MIKFLSLLCLVIGLLTIAYYFNDTARAFFGLPLAAVGIYCFYKECEK